MRTMRGSSIWMERKMGTVTKLMESSKMMTIRTDRGNVNLNHNIIE